MVTLFHLRVAQIRLSEGPMSTFGDGGKYSDLFLTALRSYGMLCIGLYRWRERTYISFLTS